MKMQRVELLQRHKIENEIENVKINKQARELRIGKKIGHF